jgi:hypothetical protein
MTGARGRRRFTLATRIALAATCGVLCLSALGRASAQAIPARLTDGEFWQMVSGFSEVGGYFRSDNFLSNEATFQYVIPELTAGRPTGGVYLGVGPEQNFTYIVALRPRMAFIFDIRRQNMIEHLMYKALMESASDRADFLSRLFSRARPPGLDSMSSAQALFAAFDSSAADTALFLKNLAAIKADLVTRHGFALTPEDLRTLQYVYDAFFTAGPDISYSFSTGAGPGRGQFGYRRMPSYADLMAATDSQGVHRSYLATESSFRALKDLEGRNLVVPLVGDFAGEKAIRAVGQYLRDHGATATAFYTSNVEQYLFRQGDDWKKYYANVAFLPLDAQSTFIRAVFNGGYRAPASGYVGTGGMRSATLLGSIQELLAAYDAGRVQAYFDVVQLSH